MANIPNRPSAGLPAQRFKVHAPRDPGNKDDFSRFVSSLNAQLGQVADKFSTIPVLDKDFDPSEFVRLDSLEDLIDRIDEVDAQVASSQGEDVTKGKNTRTSRRRRRIDEAVGAAVSAIFPDGGGAPTEVTFYSDTFTLTGSTNFFYSSGADLLTVGRVQSTVATGTAPFIVASTTKVTNLNADFLDGFDSTDFTTNAGIRKLIFLLSPPKGSETSRRPVAGSYGSSTLVPTITVDQMGRVLAVSNNALGTGTEQDPTFKKHLLLMGG